MPHPLLDGARLKVVRAQEHLNALKLEIGRYLDDPRVCHAPVEIKDNVAKAGRPVILRQPPPRLSCIVGDCCSNLRSALDYITWELACRYPPPIPFAPLDDREERGIKFPIVSTDRGKFDKSQGVTLLKDRCAVPAPTIDLIENVQPYNAGNEALAILRDLTNVDKHRLPLLTAAVVEDTILCVGGTRARRRFGISLAHGYAAAPGGAGQPPPQVKVNTQPILFVAFQDPAMPRDPVHRVLEDLVECVANIIPTFDGAF